MQVALPAIKVARSLFSSLHLPVFVAQEELAQLRALVPLGAGVHAQAEVPDTSRICMHVALGFHPGGLKLAEGGGGLAWGFLASAELVMRPTMWGI